MEPPPCRSIFSMFVLPKNMFSLAHAEMAGNIPLLFVKHEWNAETNQSAVESNPDIITEVRRQFKPADYDVLPDDGSKDEWLQLIQRESVPYLHRSFF